MNKRRSLLVGLGVGLMAGASLLQLMNYGESLSAGQPAPVELTLEQLQTQAEGKGYDLYKLSDKMYTQAQLDEAVAQAKRGGAAAGDAAAGDVASGNAAGGNAPQPSADEPQSAASPTPSATGAAEAPARLGLYVAAGDSLDKVATGLKALGVIGDKAAFIKAAKPYAGKMRVGLSVFEGQLTYDEIIAELLRGKN